MGCSDLQDITGPNPPAIDLQPTKPQALRAWDPVSQAPTPRTQASLPLRYAVPSTLYCPAPTAAGLSSWKGPVAHSEPVRPFPSHKENESTLTTPHRPLLRTYSCPPPPGNWKAPENRYRTLGIRTFPCGLMQMPRNHVNHTE